MSPYVVLTTAVVDVSRFAPDPRFRRDAALAASLVVLALFDALFVALRRRLPGRRRVGRGPGAAPPR